MRVGEPAAGALDLYGRRVDRRARLDSGSRGSCRSKPDHRQRAGRLSEHGPLPTLRQPDVLRVNSGHALFYTDVARTFAARPGDGGRERSAAAIQRSTASATLSRQYSRRLVSGRPRRACTPAPAGHVPRAPGPDLYLLVLVGPFRNCSRSLRPCSRHVRRPELTRAHPPCILHRPTRPSASSQPQTIASYRDRSSCWSASSNARPEPRRAALPSRTSTPRS